MKAKDPDFFYFKYFEDVLNKFYGFYMSRGSKKWQHLNDVAQSLGLDVRRIRYFFSPRWSSSHFEAVKAIKVNYKALLVVLTAIGIADSGFRATAIDTARELYGILEDKTFAYMVNEYLDFLYIFKQVSESFQGAQGLLVAKAGTVQSMVDRLKDLKATPGKFVSEFLKSCICEGYCELGSCTIETYFQCSYPVCAGSSVNSQKLLNSHPNFYFPNLRQKMYDSLIEGITSYFNLPLLKSFEMFDPTNFQPDMLFHLTNNHPPVACCTASAPTEADWKYICNFYFAERSQKHVSCGNAFENWKALRRNILNSEELTTNFRDTPAAFWFHALRFPGLQFKPIIKEIIELVLVTPFGSADCERGMIFSFSINYEL